MNIYPIWLAKKSNIIAGCRHFRVTFLFSKGGFYHVLFNFYPFSLQYVGFKVLFFSYAWDTGEQ